MKKNKPSPPSLFLRFFRWFCNPELRKYIEGDLLELYNEKLKTKGKRKANIIFMFDVLLLFRPGIIKSFSGIQSVNNYAMFKSYLTVGWRNLLKNKGYSIINIGGLAAGMTVAILIGLWTYDELTMNKYHGNYDRIAQVMQHASINDGTETYSSLPMPTATAIRASYSDDFKHVASTWSGERIISHEAKVFTKVGCFTESSLPEILTLEMVKGARNALDDQSAIILSESLAKAFFGDDEPINKEIKINNLFTQYVKGVYKDIPANSAFRGLTFMAPVKLLFLSGASVDNWQSSAFHIFTELNPKGDFKKTSEKIKNVLYEHTQDPTRPRLFLNPMSKWHLYEFRNGETVSGKMQFVWLFGIVGSFVLFLACINFMNLSTARAEKRAKEVGIRKAIGSLRKQLVNQFLSESLLIVVLASMIAIVLVTLSRPAFNELSAKQISVPWTEPVFWLIAILFILIISVLAGSYPAFYLASFSPVRVLKGTFKAGRFSAVPRKILVVVQFTVSVVLIVGTIIVYDQIQHARNRQVGYNREGLLTIPLNTNEIQQHYDAFRQDMLSTNAAINVALSSSPTTGIFSWADNLDWKGKDPDRQMLFGTISIDLDFGDVVAWQMNEGRDFSREFTSDSLAFIFNRSAILQMGLMEPVGETIRWHDKNWKVIGVVEDMVMTSPFAPGTPTVFMIDDRERPFNVINIKLNTSSAKQALLKTEAIFKKHAPNTPFDYKFADQEYARKFAAEERVGKLAFVFAALAIAISCLGLFGLVSFVAEQRAKEIAIRKVMGASVSQLWQLLSKDFVVLVIIACAIAIPVSFYFMNNWLMRYDYRVTISWKVFVMASVGALLITLLTVSFQSMKAALSNPVKSLRSE